MAFSLSIIRAKKHPVAHNSTGGEAYEDFFLLHAEVPLNQKIFNEYIASQSWVGEFLLSIGSYQLAEIINHRVAAYRKKILGLERPDALSSIANLASTFWNQGRWKEAEELEVQVMETRKRVLGLKHPSTLTSMANLASTYRNQGRWKEAEELEVHGDEFEGAGT